MKIFEGHSIDLLKTWDLPLDLVVTDPPYAFGGSGTEHALSATVATVLRETAQHLKRGSWMIVLSASSWRSISYMIESVRGILMPVRFGTWVKPEVKTKVRTPGWEWTSVTAVAMRRGPKNRQELSAGSGVLDWIESSPVTDGRRAQLPAAVAKWAVQPFTIPGGVFLDPFSGSGALPQEAENLGMTSYGFEISPR